MSGMEIQGRPVQSPGVQEGGGATQAAATQLSRYKPLTPSPTPRGTPVPAGTTKIDINALGRELGVSPAVMKKVETQAPELAAKDMSKPRQLTGALKEYRAISAKLAPTKEGPNLQLMDACLDQAEQALKKGDLKSAKENLAKVDVLYIQINKNECDAINALEYKSVSLANMWTTPGQLEPTEDQKIARSDARKARMSAMDALHKGDIDEANKQIKIAQELLKTIPNPPSGWYGGSGTFQYQT